VAYSQTGVVVSVIVLQSLDVYQSNMYIHAETCNWSLELC